MMMNFLLLFLTFFAFNLNASERINVEIKIKNHKFHPSKIEVSEGQVVVLIISNLDEVAEEFESADLKREKLVPAKGKIKVVVGPLAPGEYKFYGEFHNPAPQGTLIVKSHSD